MNALVDSLSKEWSFSFEPTLLQRASARNGGQGPQGPGICSARRHPWPGVELTRVSNRSRRRRDRTGSEPDSQLAVPA